MTAIQTVTVQASETGSAPPNPGRPDAWWIPAAFLLPAFIVAWGVGVIEAAHEAFGDVEEEQATA